MEIIKSKRLEKAFIHKSLKVKNDDKLEIYANEAKNIKSTLDGLEFDLKIDGKIYHFSASILGEFNVLNLIVCIKVALFLGMEVEEIQNAIKTLKNVEHRLYKIKAGGKIIIDDGFNGNLKGMMSSYDLVSSYVGRKVIVTPGIIESNVEDNTTLAKKINEIFDLVIISGQLNKDVIFSNLKKPEVIVLKNKKDLENVLAKTTKSGDLIIFSNDAPNFI